MPTKQRKIKVPIKKLQKSNKLNWRLVSIFAVLAVIVGVAAVGISRASDYSYRTQTGCPSPYNIQLRSGDTGHCVRTVQNMMNRIAGAGLSVDGKYGPKTKAAVQNFQRFFKLPVTGVVDRKTYDTIWYINGVNCTQGKSSCLQAG